jgi:hypothetical protein
MMFRIHIFFYFIIDKDLVFLLTDVQIIAVLVSTLCFSDKIFAILNSPEEYFKFEAELMDGLSG